MDIMEYITPELLVLVPVLYVVGIAFKKSELVVDRYIPLLIGVLGILLALMYVTATCGFSLMGVFTAIVQGILCASVPVYGHQAVKQLTKDQ